MQYTIRYTYTIYNKRLNSKKMTSIIQNGNAISMTDKYSLNILSGIAVFWGK